MSMVTHTWVEQYRAFPAYEELAAAVRSAVQFDFGDADEMPKVRGAEFADAKPPFDNCVVQFSTPSGKHSSHILMLWRTQPDESVALMCAMRLKDTGEWRTTSPTRITRTLQGWHYERDGFADADQQVQIGHAMCLNAFYILGCSNVRTVEHPPLTALNKKRARTGKFPILTHKTLVVVADAPKFQRHDQGGTHQSPRVHLRRGHVRRLSETHRVWVQPCVVGSKHGVVTKDYRVRSAAEVHA